MHTPTDNRARRIKAPTIYGLFDEGLLIYIGVTRLPLARRLSAHLARDKDTRLCRHLRRAISAGRKENITIRPLEGYDSEREATEAHADGILNVQAGSEEAPAWTGHDWTEEEAALIGTMPDLAVAEQIGIQEYEVEYARNKLGLPPHSQKLDEETVYALRVRSTTDEDYSHAEAARELGVTTQAVSMAVRGVNWKSVPFPDESMPEMRAAA